MAPFNPQDWPRLPDWLDPRENRQSPREITQEVLERCCMVVAFCLCFASLPPPHVVPFAFAGLLFLAGIASAGLAALRGDHLLAPHLTAWDEAALLFTASFGLHLWLGSFPVT
jgi:hypothetical protein